VDPYTIQFQSVPETEEPEEVELLKPMRAVGYVE